MRPYRFETRLILLIAIICLEGCGQAATEEDVAADQAPVSEQEQALTHLKTALDSWILGDSEEKFNAEHPDLDFMGNTLGEILLRYEIGPTRSLSTKEGRAVYYETAVTLVFQSAAGTEIKKANKFTIMPPEAAYKPGVTGVVKKWFITGS